MQKRDNIYLVNLNQVEFHIQEVGGLFTPVSVLHYNVPYTGNILTAPALGVVLV